MPTHTPNGRKLLSLSSLLLILVFSSCAVYTVDRTHFEKKLQPVSTQVSGKGLGLNKLIAMDKTKYYNRVDSMLCIDKVGKVKSRRVKYDSKVTIVTKNNKSINFYAKTLYIWNEEFLIGERSIFSLRKNNSFSVKLRDIARIEVKG